MEKKETIYLFRLFANLPLTSARFMTDSPHVGQIKLLLPLFWLTLATIVRTSGSITFTRGQFGSVAHCFGLHVLIINFHLWF